MIPVLGGDPGHEGAAVLLAANGRDAVGAWSWTRQTHLYEVHEVCNGEELRCYTAPSLHALALLMREAAGALGVPWHLCLEGLFIWPGRIIEGVVELIEAAGEIKGPLAEYAAHVERPQASTWRAKVLPRGWGRTSEEAERAALGVCRTLYPSLGAFLESTVDSEGRAVPLWPHVVEAAAIARFGWVTARGAAQVEMVSGRRR